MKSTQALFYFIGKTTGKQLTCHLSGAFFQAREASLLWLFGDNKGAKAQLELGNLFESIFRMVLFGLRNGR